MVGLQTVKGSLLVTMNTEMGFWSFKDKRMMYFSDEMSSNKHESQRIDAGRVDGLKASTVVKLILLEGVHSQALLVHSNGQVDVYSIDKSTKRLETSTNVFKQCPALRHGDSNLSDIKIT